MLFETEENVVRRVGTFDNDIGLDYASSGLYIDEKGMFHDQNAAINTTPKIKYFGVVKNKRLAPSRSIRLWTLCKT